MCLLCVNKWELSDNLNRDNCHFSEKIVTLKRVYVSFADARMKIKSIIIIIGQKKREVAEHEEMVLFIGKL